MRLREVESQIPPKITAASQKLNIGDLIVARVVKLNSPYQYTISIKGQQHPVQSEVRLQKGDFVLLALQKGGTQIKFKFIGSFSQMTDIQFARALKHFVEAQQNPLLLPYIRQALNYQTPINIIHARNLEKMYRKLQLKMNLGEDHFLFPYFFQHKAMNSENIKNPLLFSQWYWGFFQLRENLQKLVQEIDGEKSKRHLTSKLRTMLVRLEKNFSLENILRSSSNPGSSNQVRQFVHKSDNLLKEFLQITKKLNSTDSLSVNTKVYIFDAIEFLIYQIMTFQCKEWIALPIFFENAEKFLFLKKGIDEIGNEAHHFQFRLDNIWGAELQIYGLLKNNIIQIEFQHQNQEFRQFVDKNIGVLKETLKPLGLKHFSYCVSHPDRDNEFTEKINPQTSLNLNRYI